MAEQSSRQKTTFPKGLKVFRVHDETVIFPFFTHPYDRFENAMFWEMNTLLVNV
jgi:hypothetical protein